MLINISPNQTILEYLRERKIFVDAPCNGRGTCGKCHVLNVETNETILACQTLCTSQMQIEIPAAKMKVVNYLLTDEISTNFEGYGVAIDIGTTTIAMVLVKDGNVVQKYTAMNSGRMYGADVISRIDFATKNGTTVLHECLIDDLIKGLSYFNIADIKHIVVTGNTTMLHILENESCASLGVLPFTPKFLDKKTYFHKIFNAHITLLPGLSTYVGADIMGGVMALEMGNSSKTNLLIDIGTNGEMVIGNKDGFIGLATAAGPAFEGSCISCGTGSVDGAIFKFSLENNQLVYQTIGDAPAIGCCGSALVDLVAIALQLELIDETGALESTDIVITDNLRLTQADIRQIQLAKSAIRSGIELIIESFNITPAEIDTVFIAGGFGTYINVEHACQIGLFPQSFMNKIQLVGNTALAGAFKFLCTQIDATADIAKSQELNLGSMKKFNDYFVEYMLFEEII